MNPRRLEFYRKKRLVSEQINSNSFKDKINDKLIMYIYLNVCKQMTDVKLLILYSNTWNYLTMCKKKKEKKDVCRIKR